MGGLGFLPRMELEVLSRQLMATCSLSTSTPSPRLDGGESSRFPKLGPPPCTPGQHWREKQVVRRAGEAMVHDDGTGNADNCVHR